MSTANDLSPADVRLSLIAAMDENGVIGADGGMPWHIPDDLRWFKQQTLNKPILMGRRTYESIGRALPKRRNLVLTRDAGFDAQGVECVADVEQAIGIAAGDGAAELMVIGGAQVYGLTLARATTLQITRIEARYTGDTWFPAIDWDDWQLVYEQRVDATADTPAHRFMTWQRRQHA
ncbi:dihydrofolate reductase [Salinisphaera sp.]|uniref:dihydrofolate reductase n=1 Tax=Salinisphaera sp. TaxID=1914330 RepID=UPI000C4071F0|nr:dihydrofolate reductase [Salinisphaera sp.]MBS62247.1 dihydrofolate reductase [Salinisphaera sp.]